MKLSKLFIKTFLLFFTYISINALFPAASYSNDVGNCLLCHKYPGLCRIDNDGTFRLLYVNEKLFNNTVHAKVKCEGCHSDVTKIPHGDVKKVDCLQQCHIKEPSSEEPFSHKDVEKFLDESVHSKLDKSGKLKKYAEDYPVCKDCHDNPLYRPISFFKTVRAGISDVALGRCRVCHKKDDFIFRFYNHVTTRLHKLRNPENIAQTCAKCHDNEELVARHGLSTRAVFSYGETFHGKAAGFLSERIPDCLDCHVRPGESVHQMLSYKNPESSTYKDNIINACRNIDCHPNASPKLARYRVHPEFNPEKSPGTYYFQVFFIALTGCTLLPLMGLMLLDQFRRLFPRFTFKRRKKSK